VPENEGTNWKVPGSWGGRGLKFAILIFVMLARRNERWTGDGKDNNGSRIGRERQAFEAPVHIIDRVVGRTDHQP